MSSKEISRRKFIKDVAKYCGAGVAALGVVGERAHADVDDLDTPAHEGVWRMRDTQLKQYGEFIKDDALVLMKGKVDKGRGGNGNAAYADTPKFICEAVKALAAA